MVRAADASAGVGVAAGRRLFGANPGCPGLLGVFWAHPGGLGPEYAGRAVHIAQGYPAAALDSGRCDSAARTRLVQG